MSGAADFLTKPVGPLPMGAWLLVGAGGLFIASKRDRQPELVTDVREVPVPVGAIAAPDGAAVVISPIFRLPDVTPPAPAPDGAGAATPPRPDLTPPAPAQTAPSTVLRPSGVVTTKNVNPYPYPTSVPPNGARVVKDGSSREWVTVGSKPGLTGYVWNRNTGEWQRR